MKAGAGTAGPAPMDALSSRQPDSLDLLATPEQIALARAVLRNTGEGIMVATLDTTIVAANAGFCEMTGYDEEEILGQTPAILRSGRHDEGFYAAIWQTARETGTWRGRVWNRRKSGEMFPSNLTIELVRNEQNEPTHFVGVLIDQSPYSPDIREQSYYDVVTGLPNRILLNDRLEFMLAHAKRQGQTMAVLLIDLDRFKSTNDTLGYSAGDAVLQGVADRLTKTVREVDAVFRLGNDEFAVVLEEIAHVEDAAKVAKKIFKHVFTKPLRTPGGKHELYFSASIGISVYPHDGFDRETLLKNAEAAMYRAKELGENSVEHYTAGMNPRALEVLTIEYRLHKALDKNEFLVYYQPLIELERGTIVGAEALIRWQHPEMGMVSPGEFIPIAEENGLIIPIGNWVLHQACAQMKSWHDMGYPKLRISVNLSARQFQQHNLSDRIAEGLEKARLKAKSLEIEITESLGMKNAELTIKTLRELKNMGVYVALDDFGTGYSSLNYLKRFPLDTLKIDQSFVRDIGEDPDDETIVSIMIQMAHSLKLNVLAEGVENGRQLSFLRRHHCDCVQGYLFSRPLPADEFEALLKKTKGRFA